MQIHGNFEEIIIFLLLWIFFVVLTESLVEILLTAAPLEPARSFIARKSGFLAELLSCGYCFSVWVSFSIAWVLPSPMDLSIGFGISNDMLHIINHYSWWFINGLILHRLSNVFHNKVANVPDIEIIGDDDV